MKNNLLNKTAIKFIYRVFLILIIAMISLVVIVAIDSLQSEPDLIDQSEIEVSFCEYGQDC